MATLTYVVKSKSDNAQIYARFINGRSTELNTGTGLYINPIYWDSKKKRIRNVVAVPNRDAINSKLSKLETFIIDKFNLGFMEGEVFDVVWLKASIAEYFQRPKGEDKKVKNNHFVYFADFCEWWMDNHADKWRVKADKFLNEKQKQEYRYSIALFNKYQDFKKEKIKIKDVDHHLIESYLDYLDKDLNYAGSMIDLLKARVRFFLNRADGLGVKMHENFKQKVFSRKEPKDHKEPYLNEFEIEQIYRYDFSYDPELENVRDGLIIGVCTGLRMVDFNKNLKVDHIKDEVISIQTQKTGRWVEIPLHFMVKDILSRRNGELPEKIDEVIFNNKVKEVARICGIQIEMKGSLMDPKTRRKKVGVYPKYKLVSSHICRRSFATNNYGIVPNKVLMDIGGWETESIFLNYIKKSGKETANELKVAWDKKYANQ